MPFIRVRRERGGTRAARLVLVTASIAFIAAGLVLAPLGRPHGFSVPHRGR